MEFTADQFEKLWSSLDVDRSGTLDITEVALLCYMFSLSPTGVGKCTSCKKLTLFDDVLYADRLSWQQFSAELTAWERNGKQGPEPNDENVVELCKRCYETVPSSSPALIGVCKRALCEVVNTPAVDFRKWPFMADNWGEWTECKVCGTSHNADATSYLDTNVHMKPLPAGGFVCEFCSTVMCRKCADILNATAYAKPGLWILCNDLKCPNSKHNPKSYRPNKNDVYFIDPAGIVGRAHQEHRTHCYTCHKNLILNRHPVFPANAPDARAAQDAGPEGMSMEDAGKVAIKALKVASKLMELLA